MPKNKKAQVLTPDTRGIHCGNRVEYLWGGGQYATEITSAIEFNPHFYMGLLGPVHHSHYCGTNQESDLHCFSSFYYSIAVTGLGFFEAHIMLWRAEQAFA